MVCTQYSVFRRSALALLLGAALALGAGCSDDDNGTKADMGKKLDGGGDLTIDATPGDTGTVDGAADGSPGDTGTVDGTADGTPGDTGTVDGTADTGAPDTSTADTGIADMATADTIATLDGTTTGDGASATLTAPFTLDFESSCPGTGSLDWECGALGTAPSCGTTSQAPTAAHSGTRLWATKLSACYTNAGNNSGSSSTSCSNTNPSDDSILSFSVQIPSGWSGATLSFWEWVDINYYFDWNELRINGTSVKAWCNPPSSTLRMWKKTNVDLSSYVGQTVTIAFHFLASSVVAYSGWYIDDLAVTQGAPTDAGTPMTD